MKSRTMSELRKGGLFTIAGSPGDAPTSRPTGWAYQEYQDDDGATNYGILYDTQYYDLAGYEQQDDTVYPATYMVQDMGFVYGPTAASLPGNLERVDLLTDRVPDITHFTSSTNRIWNLPGTPSSDYNLEEIIAASMVRYVPSTDITGLVEVGSTQWGSGTATAARKLHTVVAYRFELDSNPIEFTIPPAGLVTPIRIDKEDNLPYLMRLKRSYELQQ